MAEELPAPLVPSDVDLTGMPFMPLDVQRLLDSELWLTGTGDECKAAVSLWCKAWQQKPAASLPDNDRLLAAYSGAGAKWKKVRAMALHAFVKCSDGRLYHPVVAEKAMEAWSERIAYRDRAAAARAAKEAKRKAGKATETDSVSTSVTETKTETATDITTDLKGQGQGQVRSPLPPLSQVKVNGHSDSDRPDEIVDAFYAIRQHIFGNTPPEKPSPKELSIAKGWLDDGATFYPLRDLFERRMQWMADRAQGAPPLTYFAPIVPEAMAQGWPGYSP